MKKIFLIFIICSVHLLATDWYIDKNATGSHNGQSWANAWTSFVTQSIFSFTTPTEDASCPTVTFNVGEVVTWSGGSGTICRLNEITDTMGLRSISGNHPTNGQTITRTESVAGSANVAVTTTTTSLTDTRRNNTVDCYVGLTITCGGKTMVITSNTATTFYGTGGWSGGGTPGNGLAWSIAVHAYTTVAGTPATFYPMSWASINPGDIVYVSGSTDSTMYYEPLEILGIHGTAANWITVRNSYDTGHNGRVIIDGDNYGVANGIILGTGTSNTSSYIYIKGFEIRHLSATGYAGISIRYPNNCITIDSCLIYNNRRECVHIFGSSPAGRNSLASATDSVTVKNCFFMTTLMDANAGQQDIIQADACTNTFIHNNIFRVRRTPYSSASHNDGIQALGTMGWRITNNFFIMDSAAYTQANILSAYDFIDSKMDSVIYYNNVFFDGGTWASPSGTGDGTVFFMKLEFANPSGTQTCPIVAIHNTIVSHGPNYKAIVVNASRDLDYFKNNIVAQFGDGNDNAQANNYKIMYESGHPVSDSINLDKYRGNLWYRERKAEWANTMFSYDSWSGGGFAQVTSMNSIATMNSKFGTSDIEADPLFQHDFSYGNHRHSSIDAYTMDDFKAGLRPQLWMPQVNSPAVNEGDNLQSVVEAMGLEWKDILGEERDGTPDIGAYNYTPPGTDTIPFFSFAEVTGAEINTEYIATSPITTVDTVSHFWTTTAASFKINYNGTYNTTMKTADPDNGADTIYVKNQSSGNYSTKTTETVVGGGYSVDFDVTTKAEPPSGVVNGGWLRGSNGKRIYDKNGKAILTRP